MPWSYNDGEELERLKTGKGEQRTRARGTEKMKSGEQTEN